MTTDESKTPQPAKTALAIVLPLMVVALSVTIVLTRSSASKRRQDADARDARDARDAKDAKNAKDAKDAARTKELKSRLDLCQTPRRVGDIQVRARGHVVEFDLVEVGEGAQPEDAVRALAEFASKAGPLVDPDDDTVELQKGGRTVYWMQGVEFAALERIWTMGTEPLVFWPPMLRDSGGKQLFPVVTKEQTTKDVATALGEWVGGG